MIESVLIVEDDEVTRMLGALVVKKAGFARNIISLANGLAAIDYYKELIQPGDKLSDSYPRIVFLDLYMPVLSGWEFLEEFMRSFLPRFPETRVVVLSSSVNPEDEVRALAYPIVIGFESKPITVSFLTSLAQHWNLSGTV
ncbi:response regulator [Telluribacter sp.]|jgi:CheY-like chemotaxis protein|uniref:response regulator n=1 Tax=Telluribacter sp. TaxID=1978767 RepID=UPI002E0E02DF|nr:response regulator [Telluribacter sp.]